MAQLLPEGMRDPLTADVIEPVEDPIQYGETWAFHFGHRCACGKLYPHMAVYGGRVQRLEGVDTLHQWIKFALTTERFRYPIYSDQFGVEFEALISRSPTAEEVETEAPRVIREALAGDERVVEVRQVRLEQSEDDGSSYFVEMEVITFTADIEEIEVLVHLDLEV